MAECLRQAQDLFAAALDRPPEDQARFLDDACGDDNALRAEVASLLASDSRAPADFMSPPGAPSFAQRRVGDGSEPPDPLIGATIGRYHIKGVIAAGGMGTVYEAVQETPHRVVALKVMNRHVPSKSALRRFQFESQVLARMRHPNVAQVYEAGMHYEKGVGSLLPERPDGCLAQKTPDPFFPGAVPYFALEYIPGAKDVCEHAAAKDLSVRDRLALFAKVCDAVHHGHQKGIIHRDLKPANILVDSHGEPKVIDFGVARATDADLAITTQQTKIGDLVGTMQYMSPEQCDADPHDIDIRSDVYSLGVVLYELLTGELPYDAGGTTIYRATVAIKEQAPRRLSEINPKLRGDAEVITLKALEKDRDKRYQSAADLAADIRRHLNREPIQARPLTGSQRLIRCAAHHPVVATSAAWLTVLALVALLTFGAVQILKHRPHKVVCVADDSAVQLMSAAGSILHTWDTEADKAIRFARFINRPPRLGEEQIVVMGCNYQARLPYRAALSAFSARGNRDKLLWTARVSTAELLPELRNERGFVGEDFSLDSAYTFDVFPELPGNEIVTVFRHTTYSPCAIRIYDLAGTLLYQAWQDGGVSLCYWMSETKLLVFGGLDAAHTWADRGHPEARDPHPLVVFAIRPEPGVVAKEWLGSTPGDGPSASVWYRCMLPPQSMYDLDLDTPPPRYNPGQSVNLTLTIDSETTAAVFWVLDSNGDEVRSSRGRNDMYRKYQDRYPDVDYFHLGPLPPVVSPREGEPRNSQR